MTYLSLLVVSSALLAEVPEHPPPKPTVTLAIYPRVTVGDVVKGRLITATLIIRNADETLWCPDVEWEWNGERSFRSSDCKPFDESSEGERKIWVQSRQRRFVGRGIVRIIVRLFKGRKILKSVEAEVPVM